MRQGVIMTTKYRINGILKSAQKDFYNTGCRLETNDFSINYSEENASLEKLLQNFADFIGVKREDLQLNACEDLGRVDAQRTENNDGFEPSSSAIERWKKDDKYFLWCVDYIAQVEKITIETVDFDKVVL